MSDAFGHANLLRASVARWGVLVARWGLLVARWGMLVAVNSCVVSAFRTYCVNASPVYLLPLSARQRMTRLAQRITTDVMDRQNQLGYFTPETYGGVQNVSNITDQFTKWTAVYFLSIQQPRLLLCKLEAPNH